MSRCLYPGFEEDLDAREFPEAFHPDIDDILPITPAHADEVDNLRFPDEPHLFASDDPFATDWMIDVDDDLEQEHKFEDERLPDPDGN